MGVEIERKFLVVGTAWRTGNGRMLAQGYLSRGNETTVRVRKDESQGFLTIKGPTVGLRRSEFEYEIPLPDAEALLQLCPSPLIEKRRYKFQEAGQTWEVDEFLGENTGLVIAEIELPAEDTVFLRPAWLGVEVSADPRYRNSNLAELPYSRWQGD